MAPIYMTAVMNTAIAGKKSKNSMKSFMVEVVDFDGISSEYYVDARSESEAYTKARECAEADFVQIDKMFVNVL